MMTKERILRELRDKCNKERHEVDHTYLGIGALISYTIEAVGVAIVETLFIAKT